MFEGGSDELRAIPESKTSTGRVTVADVRDLTEQAAALLSALDPDDVLYSESVEMWQEFSRLGRLANAGSTLVARRGG